MPAAPPTTAAPWELFAPHRDQPFPFFLDRGLGGAPSYAGSRPSSQLLVEATGQVRMRTAQHAWETVAQADPLAAIDDFLERSRVRQADGDALPRTVGFLAYELGRFADVALARLSLRTRSQRVGTPLAVLSTYDRVDVWDPRSGVAKRVELCDGAAATAMEPLPMPDAPWTATTHDEYRRAFGRIRDAIAAGDIYQANLSRRDVLACDSGAAEAYAELRGVQPVPWGSFLDFGGWALLSNSPECFLVRAGRDVVTSPIKGTRPRHADARRDAASSGELRSSAKEMAEHLMIVDLERNDLGRVAETGTVRVTSFAEVRSFATLHHLVSDVRATLKPGTGFASLLRATFPGGSITGAPKIRAMEILHEVEDGERGPYTGAIGHWNGGDRCELAIAIRTAVARPGELLCQVGGGIVADSDAGREWDETELKIAAMRRAIASRPSAASGQDVVALRRTHR